jgi:hypothetical protein
MRCFLWAEVGHDSGGPDAAFQKFKMRRCGIGAPEKSMSTSNAHTLRFLDAGFYSHDMRLKK